MSNLDDHTLQTNADVPHESRNASDELNVWRDADGAFGPGNPGRREQAAAAVIRDYGDKRYQQAIADVVEWLRSGDAFALTDHEAAQEITKRFGKGQDHG